MRSFVSRLAVVALVAGSLLADRGSLALVPILFVVVVPFERLFPRHRGQRLGRPGLVTDLAYALGSPLLSTAGFATAVAIGVLSLGWVPGLVLRPLVALLPPVLVSIAGIALFDLAVYWMHRWSHEVPALWRFHAVHHSARYMDWCSGFRMHPFDGVIVAPPFALLVAAGFSAEFTGVLAVAQTLLCLFLHANVRWRLQPLHKFVITPEFHHWHHADEPDAHHSNYSVFLPVWDLIFGTYHLPDDRRPDVYGISEEMPEGLVSQLAHPFRGSPSPGQVLRHPVVHLRRASMAVRRLLAGIRRSTFRMRRTVAPL